VISRRDKSLDNDIWRPFELQYCCIPLIAVYHGRLKWSIQLDRCISILR
jgi:hypothetical protein